MTRRTTTRPTTGGASLRDEEASPSSAGGRDDGGAGDEAPGTPPGAENAAVETPTDQSPPPAARKTLEDLLREDDSVIRSRSEPKVFAPFRTRAGTVPRRVQIERKKRKYRLDGDIDAALRGVPGAEELVNEPHALSLHFFDDWDRARCEANEQWLEPDAVNAPNGGVRARCAVYPKANKTGFPLWAHCSLVSGDPSSNTYDVRLDKNGKILPGVHRVDLCFDTEDPAAFVARRHAAYVARAKAVAALRSDFYVDSMPAERRRGRRGPRMTRRWNESSASRRRAGPSGSRSGRSTRCRAARTTGSGEGEGGAEGVPRGVPRVPMKTTRARRDGAPPERGVRGGD